MIDFPADIRDAIAPTYRGEVVYECVSCDARHPIERFAYTCPACGGLLSLRDLAFDTLKGKSGEFWQRLFAYRALASEPASLKGIFRFHELILPCVPPEDVIWLGEGHTPVIPANADLAACGRRALLHQVRRAQPLGLLQGPRHGLGDLVPQPRHQALGRARRARHLRLHRRHLGRRRPLSRLPAQGDGQVRRAAPGRQGDAPAALAAARQRGHRDPGPGRLRRLHAHRRGALARLPGLPAQLQEPGAHQRAEILRLRGGDGRRVAHRGPRAARADRQRGQRHRRHGRLPRPAAPRDDQAAAAARRGAEPPREPRLPLETARHLRAGAR